LGADGAVHLDAEAAVDLDVSVVVLPGDAEHEDAFWLNDPLEDPGVAVLGVAVEHQGQRFGDLLDGLVELGLGRILGLDLGQQRRHVLSHWISPWTMYGLPSGPILYSELRESHRLGVVHWSPGGWCGLRDLTPAASAGSARVASRRPERDPIPHRWKA